MEIKDIRADHNLKINTARRRVDGSQLWFVSFATTRIADGDAQIGYYQNFYTEPNEHDILDTYTNFLEVVRRGV